MSTLVTLPQWAAWILVIAFWAVTLATAFWWVGRIRRLPPPPRPRLRARAGRRCRNARLDFRARRVLRQLGRTWAEAERDAMLALLPGDDDE